MDLDTVTLHLGTYSTRRAYLLADYLVEAEASFPLSVRIDHRSPVRADVAVVALREDVTERQLRDACAPALARLLP